MGFVDAVFICDDQDTLLFEHTAAAGTPTFEYVIGQLAQAAREASLDADTDPSRQAGRSVFEGDKGVSLECVTRLDSHWLAAWNKLDSLTIVVIGTVEDDYIEVYSDDDDEEEEEEEEKEEGSAKSKPNTKTVASPVNPLQYVQFLNQFAFILRAFLESPAVSPGLVQQYSYRIALILQEMVDGSYVYITDLNQLRELLPNTGILHRILTTTSKLQQTATSSLQQGTRPRMRTLSTPTAVNASIFDKSGNEIPWRGVNVNYTQNEVFVDVIERVNLVVPSSGSLLAGSSQINSTSAYYDVGSTTDHHTKLPLAASIEGQIQVSSKLSGMPQIQMAVDPGSHDLGVPAFHKCVDLGSWISNGHSIDFVPPDGRFTLMRYNLNLLKEGNYATSSGIVEAELGCGAAAKGSTFEVRVRVKIKDGVSAVDNLLLDVHLPGPAYTVQVTRITRGSLERKDQGFYRWSFEKSMPTGVFCTLKGEIRLGDSETETPVKPQFVKVSYTARGSVPSGLVIRAVKLKAGLGAKVKPYKGVKYTTVAGDYVLR